MLVVRINGYVSLRPACSQISFQELTESAGPGCITHRCYTASLSQAPTHSDLMTVALVLNVQHGAHVNLDYYDDDDYYYYYHLAGCSTL